MITTLTITLREVYGRTVAYPACDQSRKLADMLGPKTLTLQALQGAKGLGFELAYVDKQGRREAKVAPLLAEYQVTA